MISHLKGERSLMEKLSHSFYSSESNKNNTLQSKLILFNTLSSACRKKYMKTRTKFLYLKNAVLVSFIKKKKKKKKENTKKQKFAENLIFFANF